jgi:exodeoxyribonuclease V alpha subunit
MVRMGPQSDSGEVLAGLVERVTYHNAENGFCVLRARARGHRDVVTVVGHAAAISAGEWIMASGEWVNDRTHGQQFKARFLRTSAPTSAEGIERYLSSGMIRGVGPVYAKKLVRAFGDKVFEARTACSNRQAAVNTAAAASATGPTTAWGFSPPETPSTSATAEIARPRRSDHLFAPYGTSWGASDGGTVERRSFGG